MRKTNKAPAVTDKQLQDAARQIVQTRCPKEEVHNAGTKHESYRRCHCRAGHEGRHFFGSWCLR